MVIVIVTVALRLDARASGVLGGYVSIANMERDKARTAEKTVARD